MESSFGKILRVAVIGARGYVGKAISESLKNDTLTELVEVTRTNYEEKKTVQKIDFQFIKEKKTVQKF